MSRRFINIFFNLKAEADLSSDEEDKLLYTKSFEEDVNLHGREYAK